MICTQCGKNVPQGLRFCDACGNPMTAQAAQTQQQYLQPMQGPYYQATKRGLKGWQIALIVVGALFVLGFIGSVINGVLNTPATPAEQEQVADSLPDTQEPIEPPKAPVVEEKFYKGGMHKVGTDIPAGEYVIIGSGYLEVAKDSEGTLDSILENDNYSNRTIVKVSEGQYLKFSGKAYTWENAPKVDVSSGVLKEGRYKVGVDFPAGEYKVTPTSTGYLAVSSSASGSIDSIITNDNFSTEKYITVKDGQYLTLKRATLALK